ncbi:NAD(P)-dependent oxidoreductase [Humibacter sp. RRB41]|uniref:NAD-dependent epimerase/dehydratase family protein n=1 Tax=Humibacter sp. RRB41 TaxID=2919946 RepID=UPI001FAAB9DC|nr:NAD-dependent epimerase/dehydratase family protein [Humibacter sp. RRB41]
MPRILVTGGAGFIGTHIVAAAVDRGWHVRVLDSLRADVHAQPDERSSWPLPADVELVHADVRDASAVFDALDGVDAVSHQAAKVGLGVDFDDTPDYVGSNELGTAVLLAQAARRGIRRLVLASSMVVYGEGRYRDDLGITTAPARTPVDLAAGCFEPPSPRTGRPMTPESIDEDAPLDPRNVYAATKVAQENLVRAWVRATSGVAAMLRYHNVYGPGMPSGTPYAGVASLFRSALERGEAPRVFEDGAQRRDFVHVADVATANIAAIEWTARREPADVRAFNIASGVPHTIGEFAASLSRAFGGPAPVVTGEFRLGDVRHITASADRARRELGFRAQMDFDDGVRDFATAALRPAVAHR